MVTHNPSTDSGQAALPHPALALGGDGESHEGIGMAECGGVAASARHTSRSGSTAFGSSGCGA